jgi:polyisoprenoid-binding protein YceI
MTETVREYGGVLLPPPGKWELDKAHTTISFVARHMLTKVRGRFGDFDGYIEVGENPEDTRAEVEVRLASVDSGEQMRDDHLRSADFFDVERFPVMTFRSTAFRPTGGTTFELDGDLTIKDVTRPITFQGEFVGWGPGMRGTTMLAGSAKATGVEREDWDLRWNVAVETGGFLVSKKVDIELEFEALHQG